MHRVRATIPIEPAPSGELKQQSGEAFVLRTQELGDADLIVTLFAEQCGKVRGVARGARKSRRRFGGRLEPLTHVRATWIEKTGRELHRIDSLDLLRSYAEMQSDPGRQAACAVVAEITETFAHEGQPDPAAFRLLSAVLESLHGGANTWIIARYFEFWTLYVHGLLPDLLHCASCDKELRAGSALWVVEGLGTCCVSCAASANATSMRLSPGQRAFLREVRRAAPQDVTGCDAELGPGSALELLLLGTLESFAERRFRTYKHLRAASGPADPERSSR